MAVQYRRCPTCGNQLAIAGQLFCAVCGTQVPLDGAPPNAPAVGPAGIASAPALGQPTPAPPPAPGGPPSTQPYAGPTATPELPLPGIPAQPYGATPALPSAGGVTRGPAVSFPVPVPVAVGIAAVAVVAVIAAFFLLSGSRNEPGITYNPSSLSCTGESFTVTMRLPASVGSGDYLAMLVDGQVWPSGTMWTPGQGGFARQSDSTWLLTTASQTPGAAECGLAPGSHTLQIVDANGLVLGQGSLTRR